MPDATRDDFLPFTERVVTKYHLPSMEKDVYIRSITQEELVSCGGGTATAKLISHALVNKDGIQLYSAKSQEDIQTLSALRSGVASELIALINHHNGLQKTMEELLGNSNASPSDE